MSQIVSRCQHVSEFIPNSYECAELIVDRPIYLLHVRHSSQSFLLCPNITLNVSNFVYGSLISLTVVMYCFWRFILKFIVILPQIRLRSSNSKPKCRYSSPLLNQAPNFPQLIIDVPNLAQPSLTCLNITQIPLKSSQVAPNSTQPFRNSSQSQMRCYNMPRTSSNVFQFVPVNSNSSQRVSSCSTVPISPSRVDRKW